METFLEILKYTLPALIVFFTAFFSLRQMINNERNTKKTELVLNNQKLMLPIRVQAYERMVLFLERISPQSMVLRVQKMEMSNQELQNTLLKTIRKEFEYNIAHQLYVSNKAWEMVKQAKENLTKEINQTALQVKSTGHSIQYSKLLLEKMLNNEKDPTRKAIQYLKSEMNELFF